MGRRTNAINTGQSRKIRDVWSPWSRVTFPLVALDKIVLTGYQCFIIVYMQRDYISKNKG